MPLQLLGFLVLTSTPGDMAEWHLFSLESPSFALSAADKALSAGSSSTAPRTRESSFMVPSGVSLGAAMRLGKPRSTHEGSGARPLWEGTRSRHSGFFGSFESVGSLENPVEFPL